MATDRVTLTVIDGQGRSSKTSFNVVTVDATNIAATNTAVTALKNAVVSLIDGAVKAAAIELARPYVYATPTDPDIQRGRKWSVTMQDATSGRLFTVQIPTAELDASTALDVNSDGTAKLDSTHWAALITVLQAAPFVGPAGGSITVKKARLVTRRA